MITLDDIQGHWTRQWIKAPGFEDHTTRVHWMQCGATYADVRIPLGRPDLTGANTLADLTPELLLRLLAAEGFAGKLRLQGSVCTWHRAINWHGKTSDVDIGDISFDDKGRLIETGVKADYTELWEHGDAPECKSWRFHGLGWIGYLVCVGTAFVLGLGRPDTPALKPVLDHLAQGSIPSEVAPLFDSLHAFGTWDGDKAIATLATNPLSEDTCVLTWDHDRILWHQVGFDGKRHDIAMDIG